MYILLYCSYCYTSNASYATCSRRQDAFRDFLTMHITSYIYIYFLLLLLLHIKRFVGMTPSVTPLPLILLHIYTHAYFFATHSYDYIYSAKIAISAFLGAHRASSERCHRSVARWPLRTPSVWDLTSSGNGNFLIFFYFFYLRTQLLRTPSVWDPLFSGICTFVLVKQVN